MVIVPGDHVALDPHCAPLTTTLTLEVTEVYPLPSRPGFVELTGRPLPGARHRQLTVRPVRLAAVRIMEPAP